MVELPSKPQLGRSARVGGCSNALSRLLPRKPGTGCLPSSQMYSSLYLVMVFGFSRNLRNRPHSCPGETGLQHYSARRNFDYGGWYAVSASVSAELAIASFYGHHV